MVSREVSEEVRGKSLASVSTRSGEISYTQLEYTKASEVGGAFGLDESEFPDQFSMNQPAPNQPFTLSQVYVPWGAMMLGACFLALLAGGLGDSHAGGRLMWAWIALSVPGGFTMLLHWAFEKSRWKESDYCPAWLQDSE